MPLDDFKDRFHSFRRLLTGLLALVGLAAAMTIPVLIAVSALTVPAVAQDAGDDDGGDDDVGDDDIDDGGPPDPPDPPDPVGTGEIPGDIDDGDETGPRDDCFEEAALRPSWLRRCDDRPVPSRRPAVARTPREPRVIASPPVRASSPSSPAVAIAAGSAPPPGRAFAAEPANALAREVVALRASSQDVAALEAEGFVVLLRSPGPLAAGDLIRFEVPDGLTTQQALARARQLAPGAIIDFNHIYRPAQAICDTLVCRQRRSIGWPQPPDECRAEVEIGIIDTTIDRSNRALSGQKLTVLDGISGGRQPAKPEHGTAIAALLVGRGDADVPGLLPRGGLVAVEAFHVSDKGEDIADTFDIVSGIDVLARRGIPVVNLSFAGPNNKVLAEVVETAINAGIILVAAAGNNGPTAPVVYPAGYESVVAVTAVGEDLRVYRGANRGRYIDFAAPGVDVQVVSAKVATRFESGTSFAAPFITAALAAARSSKTASPAELVQALQVTASDLGRPGRDTVFGWGLVQAQDVCR